MSYDRREAEMAARQVRWGLLVLLVGGPLLIGEALLFMDGWGAVAQYVIGGLMFVLACVYKAVEAHYRGKEKTP